MIAGHEGSVKMYPLSRLSRLLKSTKNESAKEKDYFRTATSSVFRDTWVISSTDVLLAGHQ